ncbi:MAG TPA: HD domain-containing phosphohydrolase [Candidatus Krumholzibacteria bacterium]|nr:HD domain-containing phosphohydrolase [Candidatus Krumholzibacteria bacterium]
MPPKTTIEKLSSSSPDVTIFKITGTLGFHEKNVLDRLFNECARRGLARVLLEVSELESLGGGCARIIRDEAHRGRIAIGLVGARRTVLKFLKNEDAPRMVLAGTIEEALPKIKAKVLAFASTPSPDLDSDDVLLSTESLEEILRLGDVSADEEDADLDSDAARAGARDAASRSESSEPERAPAPPTTDDSKQLQKRIVQYNTLFSINSDFYRFQDRKNLLDAFLLTTIAQVGVESAVFLESTKGYFVPVAMKGIEPGELRGFALSAGQLNLSKLLAKNEIATLEKSPFGDDVKAPLLALGCTYVAPFIIHDEVRGVILLGRPLKKDLDATTMDFLKILINQAAVAYESMARFEEENERTLGIVQTLISLIEENTLARGNTNMISHYVYAMTKRMHYPDEHVRDLMYGTVLRDIGMIKVSDLIVRSPRELMPEEWEIIKRHPSDGARMLKDMKFGPHAVDVVQNHHERFNGDGYPRGVQGQEIPLGARIVSVVESYAAMLQVRPTRPALSREEALNTLKENWGMRYDPEVIRCFVEIVEEEIRSGIDAGDKRFALFSV